MGLRELKLPSLGVFTDADALTNEKLEEEIRKMKKENKVENKVEKRKKK